MPALDGVDAPNISFLTSIAAVKHALDQTDYLSSQVDQQLEQQLFQTAEAASSRASTLSEVAQHANGVFQDAEELSSLLSSASRSSDSACVRIRHLDQLLTRAESALSWADDILTLRVCSEGAKTALSSDDLAAAARHVEQYLSLSDVVRNDSASATAVSQIDQSIQELSRKVRERAARLLHPDSELPINSTIDAVKLFVPIGLKNEGLEVLTSYIAQRISRESDADVRSLLIDVKSPPLTTSTVIDEPHLVALTRLFESVAGYVQDCSPFITSLFESSGTTKLIMALQKQCDTCSDRILTRYIEAKDFSQILRAVRSETANARDLDVLLNELTLLSQRTARYFSFLQNMVSDHPETQDENQLNPLTSFLSKSLLSSSQKDFTTHYMSLEVYFMRENARLAIKIDEGNGEDEEISTAVDDFFFVLRNCFQRALAFSDSECEVIRVVIQQMSSCLMNDLLVYLKRRLRETEIAMEKLLGTTAVPSSLPAAGYAVSYLTELAKVNISIPGGVEDDPNEADVAKYDFFTALNNSAVSAEYATRLRSNVEKSISASQNLSAEERTVLATAVAHITDASRALVVATEHGVSRLCTFLLSRVKSLVERSMSQASYVVSEAEYALDSDATPSFSREIAQALESKVLSSTLERRLTEKNWDALVRQVAEWFAEQMECNIFLRKGTDGRGKSFNAFGGLRVDRDVRAISAFFSGKSKRSTVRDVFGRLSQLAMVVNLERPGDVYDIWGSNAGGMTWRLSPTEVRRTLLLRSDFSSDAVRLLKL